MSRCDRTGELIYRTEFTGEDRVRDGRDTMLVDGVTLENCMHETIL